MTDQEHSPELMLVNTGDVDHPTPVSEAIMNGYAPGNELYTFDTLPKFTIEELKGLQGKSQAEVSGFVVKKLFSGALPEDELQAIIDEAYSPENFDLDPDDKNLRVTYLTEDDTWLFDLSGGPTASFKDQALQPLVPLMQALLEELAKRQQAQQAEKRLSVFGITSGDTGVAGLDALAKTPGAQGLILMPQGNVTPFQWADMAARHNPDTGLHVVEYKGMFSDLNDIHMQVDERYDVSGINSVNVGRIIFQMAYNVSLYLKTIEMSGKNVGDEVDISIQTGNMGHGLSAIMVAKEMGLPYRNIIMATNENDAAYQMITEGIVPNQQSIATDSSAQDVRNPSNLWRYIFHLWGKDPEKQAKAFELFTTAGGFALDQIGVDDPRLLEGVMAAKITAGDRDFVTRKVYTDSKRGREGGRDLIIDPHTANGIAAILKLRTTGQINRSDGVPMIAVETARPYKFDEVTSRRLGVVAGRPLRYIGLEEKVRSIKLPNVSSFDELVEYTDEHLELKRK